jgi:hypothetical protein
MVNGEAVQCPGCNGLMTIHIDKLDLGWAGDGPYARDDGFAGILADVYSCGACGRVAIRPVHVELTRARVSAA